jgi:hypothetical protein
MKVLTKVGLLLALSGLLALGCGKNPVDEGAQGLELFVKLGKLFAKPKAIDDEQQNKNTTKGTLSEGTAAAKRAAKAATPQVNPAWLDTSGIVPGDITNEYIFYEEVTNKPSEEDSQKLVTGRGEVVFQYNGDPRVAFDTTRILGIKSWSFIGHETKTWNSQTDSIRATVTFSNTVLTDIQPGLSTFWGKNISATLELGRDDTASFNVDSLDDVNSIQFGAGHFLDAHTGQDNDGAARPFDFTIRILHKGTYTNYQDNEGIINFYLPWGASSDSLYFTVHFYPLYERTGTIQKNGPAGVKLADFTYNDKSGAGSVTYYNDKGEVIASN